MVEQCVPIGIECIEKNILDDYSQLTFDYVYIYKGDIPTINPNQPTQKNYDHILEYFIKNSVRYLLIYDNQDISIYKRINH